MIEPGNHLRYSTLIHLFVAVMMLTLIFSTPRETARAQTPETPQPIQPPTPAEIIDAINALRLSYGLPALAVHPVLLALGQRQADGIAEGLHGHWHPYGLKLGKLLIMERWATRLGLISIWKEMLDSSF